MKQARLIKRGEEPEKKKTPPESPKKTQADFVRRTVKTAQAWVKDFQTNDRVNARQAFDSLFA
jgi:hypothetical protein